MGPLELHRRYTHYAIGREGGLDLDGTKHSSQLNGRHSNDGVVFNDIPHPPLETSQLTVSYSEDVNLGW